MVHTIEMADAVRRADFDRLAGGRSFYTSPEWLAFSDSDGVATACYLSALVDGSVRALLPAYWSPRENNPLYQPPIRNSLILGGRRGYLSALMLAEPADASFLPSLMEAASQRFAQTDGKWWWPYVLDKDAKAIIDAFTLDEKNVTLAGADALVDVPAGGVDEHIDGLSSKQGRTNARREIRRIDEAGLYIDEAPLGSQAPILGPLLSAVQQRYGHDHSPEQMTALLERQAQFLQNASVVFRCRRQSDDTIVGFALGYVHGNELNIRVVGFDYSATESAGAYGSLSIYSPIGYCARNGLSTLHLGMESFEAKTRRGARLRPLWEVNSERYGAREVTAKADAIAYALPASARTAFLDAVGASSALIDRA